MKVAIVTLYRELNCGAFLQAYALMKKIQKLGHDVVLIKNADNKYYWNAIKGGVLKKPFLLIHNIARLISYKKSQKIFNVKEKNITVDTVVVGSDELWNVSNKGFQQLDIYWGQGLNANKYVSYAVSCNYASEAEINKFESSKQYGLMDKFDYISVRDSHTKDVIESITDKPITIVLDPTLLLEEYPEKPIKYKNYILVYAYEGSLSEETQKQIISFARKKGLSIISYNFYNAWCDKNIFGEPLDFPSFVKEAEYVITTTFHGTIFSVIYNKKFLTVCKNNTKIECLLSQFGISNRLTDDISILQDDINYEMVNTIIREKRKEAVLFLKTALDKEGLV